MSKGCGSRVCLQALCLLFHDEVAHSFVPGNAMLLVQWFSSVLVCESFYQGLETKQWTTHNSH